MALKYFGEAKSCTYNKKICQIAWIIYTKMHEYSV